MTDIGIYPPDPGATKLTPVSVSDRSVGSRIFSTGSRGQARAGQRSQKVPGREEGRACPGSGLAHGREERRFRKRADLLRGFHSVGTADPERTASDLIGSITFAERMDFFKRWDAIQSSGSFLAYDPASISACPAGSSKPSGVATSLDRLRSTLVAVSWMKPHRLAMRGLTKLSIYFAE